MRLRHIPGCEEFIRNSTDCFYRENAMANKGKWREIFSASSNPLHIEIGMGKGQFIRDMAEHYPQINYLGIEKYESVLMKAIQRKNKSKTEYKNLYFVGVDASLLRECFETGEVDRIYLNFSDPWPKKRHAQRRLTSEVFLKIYDEILKEGGVIEFKTDNMDLFQYSMETITNHGWRLLYHSFDFHSQPESRDNVMTEYEAKFSARGQKICKLIAGRG